jgi:thiosulfate/3-mercaptopyruvate sulfurtransferase
MEKLFRKKKIMFLTGILLTMMMLLVACNEDTNDSVVPEESQEDVVSEVEDSPYISLEAAKANYNSESYIFVDARLSDAYNGWALDGISRGGHIPNAVDFPYNWLTVEVDNQEEELAKILETKGITKDKNIVVYDVEGTNALAVYDYLRGKGFEKVSMFDLNLWIADETLALEKLPNYEKIVPASIVKAVLEGEKPETFENAKNIKVVEASWGPEDASYAKGHVPGTVHINTDLVEPEPEWMLAEPELLEKFALDYGFTKDDTVIVTGAEQMAAYRVAVVLDYMGVADTRVLNGGLSAWQQAGYSVEMESHQPEPTDSFGGEIPMIPDVIMSIEELKNSLESDENFTLVDNRTWDEFIGESSGYSYHDKKGRIPGAVYGYAGIENAYSMEYFRNIDNTMRNPQEIKNLWREQGIDFDNHLAFMCGSGWRAAEVLTYAQVMGLENTSLYSDGWIGWSNDPDNPYETGIPQ